MESIQSVAIKGVTRINSLGEWHEVIEKVFVEQAV